MPVLQFPSAYFPAFTTVAITTPDDWAPFDQGDTALALVRSGEPGHYLANLIVSVRRFPSSYSLEEAVGAVETSLTAFPQLTDRGGGLMEVAGRPGYAREVSFSDPEVGILNQSVRLALVPLPDVHAVDVIDVRATVALDDGERDHREVLDLLHTLTFRSA